MKILVSFVSLALAVIAPPTFAQAGFGKMFLNVLPFSAGKATTDSAINDKAVEDALRSTADGVNKMLLPKIVDATTRLDRVEAGPGKELTYKYTVLDVRDIDLEAARAAGPAALKKQQCAKKESVAFFQHGVTMVHSYQGADKVQLMSVEISPRDCGFG